MNVLFPPVLESQAKALPFTQATTTGIYTIYFVMPEINDISKISHVQVTIKERESGRYAVSSRYSPDKQTLFLPIKDDAGVAQTTYWDYNNGNCQIKIPYKFFLNGSPKVNTTYIVQVRFGTTPIWTGGGGDGAYSGDSIDTTGFIDWRTRETLSVPSGFGEWSNQQKIYFYGESELYLDYNLFDFVPEVTFLYKPQYNDPLDKVVIRYVYTNFMSDNLSVEQAYSGQLMSDGSWSVSFKIPIAPVIPITVYVDAVTTNYTVLSTVLYISPNNEDLASSNVNLKRDYTGDFFEWILTGEEIYDGVIAKGLHITAATELRGDFISIYRVNLLTFDAFKLLDTTDVSPLYDFYFKDFGIEMGEKYIYVAVKKKITAGIEKAVSLVTSLKPWTELNTGYGRLMDMDSITYLDDKYHQLRVQGNVQVSSFKRNTSDSFTTTIGSKYPFYSRPGRMNYRTLSLSGVITVNFDPTGTFLANDPNQGLYWIDDGQIQNQLLVMNDDLYGDANFSRTRLRMKARYGGDYIEELNVQSPGDIRGPKSIYDEYLYRNTVPVISDIKQDESVYVERKFREKVMDWLSNGKPKLFRSETEGNMIVMASNISFSPVEKTSRIVYSVSMTLTEIAEYNLVNMIDYNLNGTNIQTRVTRLIPYHVRDNELVSEFTYINLLRIEPQAENYFDRSFSYYQVKPNCAEKVNKLLEYITDYSFLRGLPDSEIYDKLIFDDDPKFDIPVKGRWQSVWQDWPGIDLWEGVRYNNSDKEAHKANVYFKVLQGQFPDLLGLGDQTGPDKTKIVYTPDTSVTPPKTNPGQRISPEILIRAYETTGGPNDPVLSYDDFIIDIGWLYHDLKIALDTTRLPAQITTDTYVDIPGRVWNGVPFKELSLNPDDIMYMIYTENMPAGLTIENYHQDGAYLRFNIRGKFNSAYDVAPTLKITAKDGIQKFAGVTTNFGDNPIIKPINLNKDFVDLGYLEVGETLTGIDLSAFVNDGSGFLTYTFDGTVPGGLTLTGSVLGGTVATPAAGVEGPGQFKVIVSDDNTGDTETILVNYGKILPTFVFENLQNDDPITGACVLDYWGLKPELNYQIQIGEVFADKNINTLSVGGTKVIDGGLPFIDENGNPYYKFKLNEFYSNLKVSENGVLSSTAGTGTVGDVVISITASDARGKEITRTLLYKQVFSNISFNYQEGELAFPSAIVNTNPLDYKIEIDGSRISGGYYDAAVGYRITSVDLPAWMTITPDGAGNFTIQGTGTYPNPVSTTSKWYTIRIADSKDESGNTLDFKIKVGRIDEVLTAASAINLGTEKWQKGQSFDFNLTALLNIQNGHEPYTLTALTEADAAKMSPYEIKNEDKDGHYTTDFWLKGTIEDQVDREFDLILTSGSDDDGTYQAQKITVRMDQSAEGLTCHLKEWSPEDWSSGEQGMFRNDEVLIEGLSVINIPKAIWAEDGVKDYKYYFYNGKDPLYQIWPGVTLTGDAIVGTPTQVGTGYLIEPFFYVRDNYTGASFADNSVTAYYLSQVGVNRHTFPTVIGQILSQGEHRAGVVYEHYYYQSPPLFKGSIGDAAHPHLEFLYNGAPIPNQYKFGDTGLYWNEDTCRIESSRDTGVEKIESGFTIQITAHIPGNKFRSDRGDVNQVATLIFDAGSAAALSWTDGEGATIEGSLSLTIMKTQVGQPVNINLDRYFTGGVGPYVLEVVSGANWTFGGTTLQRTTPLTELSREDVQIKVTDAEGTSITGTIRYDGAFKPFTVDDSGWRNIEEKTASGGTFSWADYGYLKSSVTGGSGSYSWSVEAVGGSTSLRPYIDTDASIYTGDDLESIVTDFGYDSYPARQFKITVRDKVNFTEHSKTITVGKITGRATNIKKIKLTGGQVGTTFNQSFNIAEYFEGGNTFAFELKFPGTTPWPKDGGYEGAFNITNDGTQITITGTYPPSVKNATTFDLVLKNSGVTGGPDLDFAIEVEPVSGNMTYTSSINPVPAGAVSTVVDNVGTFNNVPTGVVSYVLDNFVSTDPGWAADNITVDPTTGILKITRPDIACGAATLTFNVIASETDDIGGMLDRVDNITINVGAVS